MSKSCTNDRSMPVDADDILLAACHRAFKDIGSTFEGAEDYFDKETLESIAKHWDNLWNEILEEREGFRTAKAACENAIKNAKEKKAKYASAIVAAESERCTPNRRAIEARDAQIADLSTGIQSLRERNDKLHQQLQSIGALPQANVAPSIVGTATAAPRASRKPAKRSQPLRRAKAVKVEEEEEEVDGPGLVPSPSSEEDEPPLKKSRQARKHNPFKLQPATTDHIMVHPPQRLRDPDACRPVAETSQEVQDAVFSLTEICYAAIKLQDSTVQRRQACCMRRLYERAKGGSAIKLQPEACDVCVEKRKPCMQSWPDNAEQSMWFLVPLPAKERMGVDDENALEFYVKS